MDPSEESKKSLSFGFLKKRETIQLTKSAVGDHEEKEDVSKDFVVSLEGKELKSTKPKSDADRNKKSKRDYVIPLINQNRWRTDKQDDTTSDKLDLQAAEEILQQSAMLNDEWDKKGSTEETTRSIPLLMQNKVPEGFETDSKLDVKLRPEEPNDANYDEIPIEHFGLAMLRGMGWNESRGVGRHGKVIAPVEAQIRPKGLGLGADKTNKEGKKDVKNSTEVKGDEQMDLKKGSCCVVTIGSNKGLYGVVEGIDEDNSRVMVKLTLSGKTVNLIQCNIDVIAKKEYEKYSKYLNKEKVDRYKKDEEEKRVNREKRSKQNGYDDSKKSHKRQQVDENRSDSDDHEKKFKKRRKEDNEHSSSRHRKHSKSKYKSHKRSKDRKHDSEKQIPQREDDKKRHQTESPGSESDDENETDDKAVSENQRPWLRQDLRVRVVDRSFQNFYKEKVIIVDVPVPGLCVCKASDGKVLDGISQSSLETVIPRDDSSFVLIVSGSHRGQVGQIMKRDKDQCLALVQLLSDRDIVLKLGYDQVCEYVGDVHSRDDY